MCSAPRKIPSFSSDAIAGRSGGRWLGTVSTLLVLAVCAGCSQYIDPNVPEPIRPKVEPQFGGEYLLYRPSNYDRRFAWPLVIVCHTSFGDSPNRAIRDWTQAAESSGFLVAAPALSAPAEHFPPEVEEQLPLLERDERHILSMIRHVRAGHNVSEERVFIHGWSGGAYSALYVGMSNPDVFRAVTLIEPRFEPAYFETLGRGIDAHQPIWVHYSSGDALTGRQARRCADWLRQHGADVHEDPFGPARRSDTDRAVQFYETVLRKIPWVHIRAFAASPDEPLAVQFKLRSSHNLSQMHWEFGDGKTADEAEPIHQYSEPGTYVVTVGLIGPNDRPLHRRARVTVPAAFVQPIIGTSAAKPSE